MDLIEPMYMIGASIGGTVVAMFTTKYPKYVSMICLLAPPRKFQ
jgi:alpha-beta hydrolase superfamily lysophospholipase